jgi:predicted nucleotidyltransferase component of viral defense system
LYNKKDLEKIASETGFIRDNLEKIFRLYDILKFLNENPLFSENLALKGGTAINLLVFDLPRLSVDIDLDFTKACMKKEMQQIRDQINKELVNYLFSQDYALSPDTRTPHSLDSWVFFYQNAAGNKDNIKIEINYSLRNHILPLIKKDAKSDFLPPNKIRGLSPLELFGSKIKALLERAAARDLYDVYNMLNAKLFKDEELSTLRKIILFYCAVGGNKPPTTEFKFDAINNIKFPQIRSSLLPVLRKTERFDFEKAKLEVKEFLSNLLVLTDDEKLFIEKFNQKEYCPELLFEDKELLERIKEHPMAIWKTRK